MKKRDKNKNKQKQNYKATFYNQTTAELLHEHSLVNFS